MLSIGELSKVTGLTVKTIRLYHDKAILPPSVVSEETGYRYYDAASVERARIIKQLRDLDFSIAEIAAILEAAPKTDGDEADIVAFLERHRDAIANKLQRYEHIHSALQTIIRTEKEAVMVTEATPFEIEEKTLDELLIAGIRAKGCYGDSGPRFKKLGRAVGRHIAGKPLNLYYDPEYKEKDADFESCFPIRKAVDGKDGIEVRKLEGGRCVTLLHRGPYEALGRSYEKIFAHIRAKGLEPKLPSREIYIKGPGMIFKGNPKKYLTEIQVLVG